MGRFDKVSPAIYRSQWAARGRARARPQASRQNVNEDKTLQNPDKRPTAAVQPKPADPRAWLSDEVAIDFPSARAVVDRICHALEDDDAATRSLLAEISLSQREATDGATVPFTVPVRATCTVCGGRGESWTEACRACEGSGTALLDHLVRLSFPARVSNGSRFFFRISAPQATTTRIEVRIAIR